MTTFWSDTFDEPGRTTLGSSYTILGGGFIVTDGQAKANVATSLAGRNNASADGPVQHLRFVVGSAGAHVGFTHVSSGGSISIGVKFSATQIGVCNSSRAFVSGATAAATQKAGDVVDLYNNGLTRTVQVWLNGTKVAENVYASDLSANRGSAFGSFAASGTGFDAVSFDDAPAPAGSDSTAPEVPADLTLTAGVESLAYSFTGVPDADLDHYERRIGMTNPPTGTAVSIGTSTTGTVTGLSAGSRYYMQVRAVDYAQNASGWSAAATTVVLASADTMPPTAPSGLTATASSATSVALTWQAGTDDVAVTGYQVLRNGTVIATTGANTLSYTDATAQTATTYSYTVRAVDAAGNVSPASNTATVTTPTPSGDATPPVITMTAPAAGATVTGAVSVTGTASDNVGVTSVAVLLNGSTVLGYATVSGNTWAYSWNSAATADGPYSLSARAADAVGNTATTTARSITVSNLPAVTVPSATTLPVGQVLSYWTGGEEVPVKVDALTDRALAYQFEGVDLDCRGDSLGAPPGNVPVSPKGSFHARLERRLGFASRTNNHVGGDTVQDAALRAIGTSKTFDAPKYGVVTLVAGTNDVGFHHGKAAGLTGYANGIRTIASLCRASSVVPAAAATATGTWATVTSAIGSGGSYRTATEPGASLSFTFTGTDATLVLVGPSDGTTGSNYQVTVDGVQKATGTTLGQALPTVNHPTSGFPVAILLRGLVSGAHTVTVTHTGASGDTLGINAFLPWGTTAAQLVILEPIKAGTAGWANYNAPRPVDNDVEVYRQRLAQTLATLPQGGSILTATPDALEGVNATHTGSDNLHPNDRGHSVLASIIVATLQATTWRNGLNRSIRAV